MTGAQFEIQLIACLVSIACVIPGVFLVLRKMSMISDAISHSILPGLVLGFFMVQDLSSPWLILFAAAMGVLTVFLVEQIKNTGLVKEDTSIGLVFPLFFSIGVVLIARGAKDVHLDLDAVLLGEVAFAPLNRWYVGDADLGPKALWVMGAICVLSIILVTTYFKELKLSTFDKGLAATFGFSPVLIHYGLMMLSSVTIVGAFDAVGAILVVGFMIIPAATAYLLTNDVRKMIIIACFMGSASSILGYWLAHAVDGSIAGAITTVMGFIFVLVFFFSPEFGYFTAVFRRKNQRENIALMTLLLHLRSHTENRELSVKHLQEHINWSSEKANKILKLAKKEKLVNEENGELVLTKKGQERSNISIHDYLNR